MDNTIAVSSRKGVALYKTFLFFYPKPYRKRFGQQMLLTFEAMYQEELAKGQKIGIGFWLAVLIDTIQSAIAQHRDTIRRYGVKHYLKNTLHINGYNIIGSTLLLPFFLLFGSDFLSRVIQWNFFHPNVAFYNSLSHTILYSGSAPLLWAILVYAPLVAVVINLIPFALQLNQKKGKLSLSKFLFLNPLALGIMALGLFFLLIVFGHDAAPCFVNHLLSNGPGRFRQIIAMCKNA